MNLKKRAAFVGWFLLAAATASGCLTTYDTEAEKYVPSEPSNSCATGAVEVCDGVDNDCNDQVDEGCNDDADEHCDSAMVVNNDATNTPPAVCPAGGGDCDDTDRDVHPGTTDVCDDVDNDCNDNADEGCNPDGDEYCAIGSVVINQVSGAGPNVCPRAQETATRAPPTSSLERPSSATTSTTTATRRRTRAATKTATESVTPQ